MFVMPLRVPLRACGRPVACPACCPRCPPRTMVAAGPPLDRPAPAAAAHKKRGEKDQKRCRLHNKSSTGRRHGSRRAAAGACEGRGGCLRTWRGVRGCGCGVRGARAGARTPGRAAQWCSPTTAGHTWPMGNYWPSVDGGGPRVSLAYLLPVLRFPFLPLSSLLSSLFPLFFLSYLFIYLFVHACALHPRRTIRPSWARRRPATRRWSSSTWAPPSPPVRAPPPFPPDRR